MQPPQMCSRYWSKYKQLVRTGSFTCKCRNSTWLHGWKMDGWENGYWILHRPFYNVPSRSTRAGLFNREHQDDSRWAGLVFGPVFSHVSGWERVMDGWIDSSQRHHLAQLYTNRKWANGGGGDAEKARIKNAPMRLNVLNEKPKPTHSLRVANPKRRRWERRGNTLAGVPNKTSLLQTAVEDYESSRRMCV